MLWVRLWDVGKQIPQPLLTPLSLRSSWLLPGVLESGQNIIAGEGNAEEGNASRSAQTVLTGGAVDEGSPTR